MKGSKRLKSMLALILAAAAAVAGWQGWRSWQRVTGRGQAVLTPGDAQPSSASVAAETNVPATQALAHATQSTAANDGETPDQEASTGVAEDGALALRADDADPETAEELAELLPDPDRSIAELSDETPLTADRAADEPAQPAVDSQPSASEPELDPAADDGVDQVLEVLAAEADAREPSTIQTRFGPNAIAADEGGDCPPDHPVKGNTNSMIFHLPGQSSYGATMAEVCFADGDAAEAAGFRPRKR